MGLRNLNITLNPKPAVFGVHGIEPERTVNGRRVVRLRVSVHPLETRLDCDRSRDDRIGRCLSWLQCDDSEGEAQGVYNRGRNN